MTRESYDRFFRRKSGEGGEAGHYGKDVRSDLHVAVEPRDGGGLDITMESRVAPYYGGSILAQARQVLEVLGIKHARVAIHDEGALPFVISARIEAAAKRAGLGLGRKASPEHSLCRNRLRETGCGGRGCIFPARSLNIASMRHCMSRTPSFSISRIRSIMRKKTRRAFGAQHSTSSGFRQVRAHGAHQPVAVGTRRPGGDCP